VEGIIFLTNEAMVKDAERANFAPEMSALANSFKAKFGGDDPHVIYTIPGKTLAPGITRPEGIKGKSTAIEVTQWTEVAGVIDAAVKTAGK